MKKIYGLILVAILAISVVNTCNAGIVDYRHYEGQAYSNINHKTGLEFILSQDSTLEGKFLRLKAIDYIEKNFEHNYTVRGCGTGVSGGDYNRVVSSRTDFEDVTENQSYFLHVLWEYNYPNYDESPTITHDNVY
ncbi:MAG: hypothetical protein LBT10_09650 [Methanobrevibacter sp.]|jgi:hypothetical protein|nr:hypothetical protein [Methanobrevibacter sp.]